VQANPPSQPRTAYDYPHSSLLLTPTCSKCTYGQNCKFSHDLRGFIDSKGPDLPGPCPFSALDRCPYGRLR